MGRESGLRWIDGGDAAGVSSSRLAAEYAPCRLDDFASHVVLNSADGRERMEPLGVECGEDGLLFGCDE
jgi:hypothetical protein